MALIFSPRFILPMAFSSASSASRVPGSSLNSILLVSSRMIMGTLTKITSGTTRTIQSTYIISVPV